MSFLSVKNLSLDYQSGNNITPALKDISFALEQGLICALAGPSGGGKSSLLNILGGVIRSYRGAVFLGGEPLDPKRHQVALVPQSYGLLPWKTIKENILLPLQLGKRALSPNERNEVISSLGLCELLSRYPHELSGGQCQRAALARAFCMKPDLLLLDEAFSALDITTGEKSRRLFLDLWQRYPTTTILVTHNPYEAVSLSERTIVIGGKPGQILSDLQKPTEESLKAELYQAYSYDANE